jgi:predicted SnoaL-like aldol condensation-catalyzing enzyme
VGPSLEYHPIAAQGFTRPGVVRTVAPGTALGTVPGATAMTTGSAVPVRPRAGNASRPDTINVSVCDYFRVDDGALTEHWGIMDAAGMMRQLTAH